MTSTIDEFDIYSDLLGSEEREGKENDHQTCEVNLSDFAFLENWQKRMAEEKTQMKNELNESKAKLAKLEKVNNILKANISSLFKTAKAELQRKNDQIAELTNKLDDIIFRRHRNSSTTQEDKYDKSKHKGSSQSSHQSRSSSQSKDTNFQGSSYSSHSASKDHHYHDSLKSHKRSFDHSQSSHNSEFGQNSKKFKTNQHYQQQ